jgi:hypothetical protein
MIYNILSYEQIMCKDLRRKFYFKNVIHTWNNS